MVEQVGQPGRTSAVAHQPVGGLRLPRLHEQPYQQRAADHGKRHGNDHHHAYCLACAGVLIRNGVERAA